MFNIISWDLFLTTLAVVVIVYYTISSFTLYRSELSDWINSLSHPSAKKPHTTPIETRSSEDMMGVAQASIQQSSVRATQISSEELITSGEEEEEEPEQVQELILHEVVIQEIVTQEGIAQEGGTQGVKIKSDILIGSVADLLEELKTLLQLIAEYQTGKQESEALLNALFIRYPYLQPTSYRQAISFYVLEETKGKLAFDLTFDDLQTWWDSTTGSSKTNHSN